MKRTKTSKAWMQEHVTDPWVQRAKAEGWRSRATFKLMEIDAKDKLMKPGTIVVDLGATPGGWSQLAIQKVKPGGRVIGLDLLPMEPLHGVEFFLGDFREEETLAKLRETLQGEKPGLVLSDMAPNMSGVGLCDQAKAMYLAELALEFAAEELKVGGDFLVKVFQGTGFDEFRAAMGKVFESVQVRKPDSSRDRSAEVYLLGRRRRPGA
ncbi:MAG: SAM-dependent methyltransferase [Rhodocyclaceae bacterium]|nr:SAM-dependent methyltransferase [Rhodocyclaceae bacterium]